MKSYEILLSPVLQEIAIADWNEDSQQIRNWIILIIV